MMSALQQAIFHQRDQSELVVVSLQRVLIERAKIHRSMIPVRRQGDAW